MRNRRLTGLRKFRDAIIVNEECTPSETLVCIDLVMGHHDTCNICGNISVGPKTYLESWDAGSNVGKTGDVKTCFVGFEKKSLVY